LAPSRPYGAEMTTSQAARTLPTWADRDGNLVGTLGIRPAPHSARSPPPMPVTVVATMKAKPESVDTVRDACKQAI
jgi:hypothetical protein